MKEDDQEIRSGLAKERGIGVAFISSFKFLGKEKETSAQFHPWGLITSLSHRDSSLLFRGPEIKIRRGPFPIHLSNQKERQLSFPAIHLVPLLNTGSPFRIAAKVVEHIWYLELGLRCPLQLRYFWERTRAHRE